MAQHQCMVTFITVANRAVQGYGYYLCKSSPRTCIGYTTRWRGGLYVIYTTEAEGPSLCNLNHVNIDIKRYNIPAHKFNWPFTLLISSATMLLLSTWNATVFVWTTRPFATESLLRSELERRLLLDCRRLSAQLHLFLYVQHLSQINIASPKYCSYSYGNGSCIFVFTQVCEVRNMLAASFSLPLLYIVQLHLWTLVR